MNRLISARTALALVTALAASPLAGCGDAPPDISINRIQVRPVQQAHEVYFAPGSVALGSVEAEDLRAFVGGGRQAKVNGVTLASGTSAVAKARVDQVSDTLSGLGIPHTVLTADPNLSNDVVVVTALRLLALPPKCPNVPVFGPYDPSNAASSNLGCANTTNLYLMVADPRDLVAGRKLSPADAEPGIRAVQAYRTGDQSLNPQPASLLGSASTSGGSGGGGGGQ